MPPRATGRPRSRRGARRDRPGTRPLARRLVCTRSGERPAVALVGRVRRRQPERVLGELGRHGRRAAIPRLPDGSVERGCHGGVRLVPREREVRARSSGSSTTAAIRACTRRRPSPRPGRAPTRAAGARSARRRPRRSITCAATAGSSASPDDAGPLEQRLRRRAERRRERERVARASRQRRRCARRAAPRASRERAAARAGRRRRRARARPRARRTGFPPTARGSGAASAARTAGRAGHAGRDAGRRRSAARPQPAGCSSPDARARARARRRAAPRAAARAAGAPAPRPAAAARTRARATSGRSSHWTSSIATRSGPGSASSCSTSRTATARARSIDGLVGPLLQQRDLERPPPRRAAARAASRRATSSRRSPRPACASPRSASAGRDASTTQARARACSTPARQSVDLPIPASPSRTSAAGPSCGSVHERCDGGQLLFPADDLERHLPRADGDRERGMASLAYGVARRAVTMPADHPGARPPAGGRIDSTSRPLAVTSHDTTEFEFHMSPVPSSSRPQTGLGTRGARSSSRRATPARPSGAAGCRTASPRSGMTPSRQQRTS